MIGKRDSLPDDLAECEHSGYTVHFIVDELFIMGSIAGRDTAGQYWITQFNNPDPIAKIGRATLDLLISENAAYVPPKDDK